MSTHYVGRTAEGHRAFVHIDLTPKQGGGQTVEHAEAPDGLRLSIQGTVMTERGTTDRSVIGAGQCIDDVSEVTRPARGWTAVDVVSLVNVWRRWHLNDMRAACAHMPEDAHARWEAREQVVCSAGSGYRYGSAWLVEPLPPEVLTEVQRLQALPTGDVPDFIRY